MYVTKARTSCSTSGLLDDAPCAGLWIILSQAVLDTVAKVQVVVGGTAALTGAPQHEHPSVGQAQRTPPPLTSPVDSPPPGTCQFTPGAGEGYALPSELRGSATSLHPCGSVSHRMGGAGWFFSLISSLCLVRSTDLPYDGRSTYAPVLPPNHCWPPATKRPPPTREQAVKFKRGVGSLKAESSHLRDFMCQGPIDQLPNGGALDTIENGKGAISIGVNCRTTIV